MGLVEGKLTHWKARKEEPFGDALGGLQTQLVPVLLTQERDCIIGLDHNAQHQLRIPNTNSILLMLHEDYVMQSSRDRAAVVGLNPRRGSKKKTFRSNLP